MRALMHDKGVDKVTALLVTEGIAGCAGFFSAATVSRSDNSMQTAAFLADSGIVLKVAMDNRRNMVFSVVENTEAMREALAFFGGENHV